MWKQLRLTCTCILTCTLTVTELQIHTQYWGTSSRLNITDKIVFTSHTLLAKDIISNIVQPNDSAFHFGLPNYLQIEY